MSAVIYVIQSLKRHDGPVISVHLSTVCAVRLRQEEIVKAKTTQTQL